MNAEDEENCIDFIEAHKICLRAKGFRAWFILSPFKFIILISKPMSNKVKTSRRFFDGVSRGILSGKKDRFKGLIIDESLIEPKTDPSSFK